MSFPSIEQFRNMVATVRFSAQYVGNDALGEPVYDTSIPLPKMRLRGTVKIHGTNAGVALPDGHVVAFSRQEEISVTNDNAGFARFVLENSETFEQILSSFEIPVELRGEWCGKGIQRGTAVNELEKMFVVFAIRTEDGWLDVTQCMHIERPENRIFNIARFGCYEIEVDFDAPETAQDALESITEAVEAECPVGRHFGVSGVGEGVVWTAIDSEYEGSKFWFKVKGDKHKVTKTKRLVEIDPEVASSLAAFVDATVSEQRLLQGVSVLETSGLEVGQSSTGAFMKGIFDDIIKEGSDRLAVSGLEVKDVSKAVSNRAKRWWFDYLKNVGFS